jgi:hypothetical protein
MSRCDYQRRVCEIYAKGVRVALHPRSSIRYGFTTDPSHMPASHRAHLEWSPSRIINWAKNTGPITGALVEGVLERRLHPEQGYRSCLSHHESCKDVLTRASRGSL